MSKCLRDGCNLYKHTIIENNGGSYCCYCCKMNWGHGPCCENIFFLNDINQYINKDIKKEELILGWAQDYKALFYHMDDAFIEAGNTEKPGLSDRPPFAIFANKYYNEINSLDHTKIYDYCFIGAISSAYNERTWVIDFAKKHFTSKSYYINTDINYNNDENYELLGSFDYSTKKFGFCPKHNTDNQSRRIQYRIVQENLPYFQTMCQSKYVLCPAGDAPWSFRFYETLMCKSIPMVKSWHHTYRTVEEAAIKYKYILPNTKLTDNDYTDYINTNNIIFKHFHMLQK